MQQVTAAGGVVYRQAGPACEILLIFRNGLWDLPKGKKEEGESVEECARREVAEETGIPLPEVDQRLAETYHEYQRGAKKYGKTTHWFSMKSTMEDDFTPQKAEGIYAVQWAPLNEALEMVGFKNLKKVLADHRKSLK